MQRVNITVRPLEPSEVPALAALDAAAWPPSLQASEELIRRRLALGHTMLVVPAGDQLVAAVCFVATRELPFDAARFPRNFGEFSSLPRTEPVRSIYVYNLCVHPEHRGKNIVQSNLGAAIEFARALGARWLVGDGRCPSYAGTDGKGPEKVRASLEFRAALDEWAAGGKMPPVNVLIHDPVLRFYHRVLGCQFLHLAPNFLTQDTSSGGYRVIFVKDLGEQGISA